MYLAQFCFHSLSVIVVVRQYQSSPTIKYMNYCKVSNKLNFKLKQVKQPFISFQISQVALISLLLGGLKQEWLSRFKVLSIGFLSLVIAPYTLNSQVPSLCFAITWVLSLDFKFKLKPLYIAYSFSSFLKSSGIWKSIRTFQGRVGQIILFFKMRTMY